ncbi:Uncharacterized protein TCAP_05970 [Tolypocladium capitatum]|uniref:Uncharacterized protein n=1 Tax=Tolypocladium capitatum TaxID=45235 RepID=A0A2K3Q943_9HYPO|nr:Uncharacterized protein TCAP_05970 [Tolypocladium capitatum]
MAVTRDETTPAAAAPIKAVGNAAPVTSGVASGVASGSNGVAGHALRRAKTVDESLPTRRRSFAGRSDASLEGPPPRRSSNFSDYGSEARAILNPKPQAGVELPSPEPSPLASLSLAFALLPAITGALFKNGHAVVTDIMLLGLAGVFLHWSVTQPWVWYHSAQQVRAQHEADCSDVVLEDESDLESPGPAARPTSPLDDVPEEEETGSVPPAPEVQSRGKQTTAQQQAALRELYIHEVLSLVACLVLPLVGAYLLHAIRSQLSRPSEGIISNYNLTIFLLVSELRVFSHMLKLVQSRTLHLQRIVHGSPFASSPGVAAQMEDVVGRIERLEARSMADEVAMERGAGPDAARAKQEAALTRDVRNAIQPELDALNRAVRRYEKKATLLQFQTESRFSGLDARMDDAIALAAAAAKNSAARGSLLARTVEPAVAIALFPFNAIIRLLLLPLKSLLALVDRNKNKQKQPLAKPGRGSSRTGKAPAQSRYSGDGVPIRVTKR